MLLINIINNSGVVNNSSVLPPRAIIPMNITIAHITTRHKGPIPRRNIYVNINIHPGTQRSPAIIGRRMPPGNPGRSPNSARNPNPAIIIIKSPATIMKRRPTPLIIGYPGPAIAGIYPMPVSGIRSEISGYPWHPYLPIPAIGHPSSIWTQRLVKKVDGYPWLSL